MRAIWTGAIGFGLINIPVGMYSAVQSSSLDLDMLDKHDNGKIRYQRVNEDTGEEVAWGDIVKGYKLKNKYVVLDDADFEKASPKKSQVIEIDEFVDEEAIDSTFYETPYYLAPRDSGEKPYALLRDALKKSKKLAIGTYVARGRMHIAAIKPIDNALVLLRLRFAEEIRDAGELNLPGKVSLKPNELKMATTLIDQLTSKSFSIARYKDTYNAALMRLIRKKASGKAVSEPRFKMVRTPSKDLMAQLKASLENSTKRKKAS